MKITETLAMATGPKDTTSVDPATLPDQDMLMSEDKLINVPATLEEAIVRLRAVETALDDLSRASEIAEYSGQFEVLGSFRAIADELLATKIAIDHSEATEMKITIVE